MITASPDFMARPWLEQYFGVRPENVHGARLEEKGGRFTGLAGALPIGETKVSASECAKQSFPTVHTHALKQSP